MKLITTTILAFAAANGFATANGDETPATEIIVVTAERPAPPERTRISVAAENIAIKFDFSRLAIEAPRLDPAGTSGTHPRIELAVSRESDSKS